MLMCWCSNYFQISLKLILILLATVFYITILYRESLNAIGHNRAHIHQKEVIGSGAASIILTTDLASYPPVTIRNISVRGNLKIHLLPVTPSHWSTPVHKSALTTSNPVYEYSEEIHRATEEQLELRKNHLQEICKKYSLQAVFPPRPQEFFISTGHNLIWCNVFKAASSTWMYYFNILGGYDSKYLQRTKKQPLQLARRRFPRPELNELYESLPNSLSFLFVRDPFERILSAYRDKLEGGRNHFYRTLGRRIAYRFRRTSIHGSGPTFKEFVSYLIFQHRQNIRPLDEHWAPIYKFCTPCSLNFKIIGKVETFNRDSEFIIRQAGLESLLLGKLPSTTLQRVGNLAKGIKTGNVIANYFKDIDRSMLEQLLRIYRLDFELFDYDYSKYFEYIKGSSSAT